MQVTLCVNIPDFEMRGVHFPCALFKSYLLESKTAFSLPLTYDTNCAHMEANSQQKHISILMPLDDQSISLI